MAKIVGGDGWQTSDGTRFDSQDAAQSHQDGLDGKGGGGGGAGFFAIFFFIYLAIAAITAPIFKRIGRWGQLGRVIQSLLWGAAWGIYALYACEVLRMYFHYSEYFTPFAWIAGTLVAAIWFYLREWYVLQRMDEDDENKDHRFFAKMDVFYKTGVPPDYTHMTAMVYMFAATFPTIIMVMQLFLPVFGLNDFKELLFNTILQGHIYELPILVGMLLALHRYFKMTRGYAEDVMDVIKAPLDAVERIGFIFTIVLIVGTFGGRIFYVNVIENPARAITGLNMIVWKDTGLYALGENKIVGTIKAGERVVAQGEYEYYEFPVAEDDPGANKFYYEDGTISAVATGFFTPH